MGMTIGAFERSWMKARLVLAILDRILDWLSSNYRNYLAFYENPNKLSVLSLSG